MTDEKYIELMNSEIDGGNSAHQTKMLMEYLDKNSDARQMFNDLLSLGNSLRAVRQSEPPENLKKNVMNAIRGGISGQEKRGFAFLSRFGSILPKSNVRYAYVFAFGLLAGIIVYSVFGGDFFTKNLRDHSDLYGTILPNETYNGSRIVDQASWKLAEAAGSTKILSSGNVVLADIEIEAAPDVELIMGFDQSAMKFSAFRQFTMAGSRLESGEDYVRMTNIGHNHYIVIFDGNGKGGSPLTLKLVISGRLILEKTLHSGVSAG